MQKDRHANRKQNMRIAIIGAGNAGRSLAAKLCDLNHEVVMVDSNPETLEEVSQGLDVMTLEGNGADPTIFERENLGDWKWWPPSPPATK